MAFGQPTYGYPQYGYQNQFNPYQYGTQQQIPQTQVSNTYPQQTISQPTLYGKMVDGIEVVKAMDQPIGTNGIYPKADMSEVFIKGWNADGSTFIKSYKLSDVNEDTITPPIDWEEKLDDIYNSIDSLNKKIDKMKSSSPTTTRKKKIVEEVDDDE